MTQTPDERQTEYIRFFGQTAGPVYYALENEHFWLRLKWQEFAALFRSEGRVQILNAAAPDFFHMLQDALSDDILMHVARLTDPAKSSNKENLTVRVLPDLLPNVGRELCDLVAEAVSDAEFARDWRNRRLAHRDLALALGTAAHALLPATHNSLERAVQSLHRIFAEVAHRCFGAHLESEVVEARGGAEGLLYVLRDGVKYREERLVRFDAGDEEAGDLYSLPP